MAEFSFPSEWGDLPSPPSPNIDPDRIEGLQNGFLAATQDALHTAPDAFYLKRGQDAVEGAPALQERLFQMRDDALAQAKDDNERAALTPRLDANLTYIQAGIDRHVAAQKRLRNQRIAEGRQILNLRLATLEHDDDSILPSVAEANASVAQHLARLRSEPEEPAMLAARSAVWRNAIDQRLANGQNASALDLFGRVQDQLVPADQRILELPIQTAQTDVAADQWIAREAGKPGAPLIARVRADAGLSVAEKGTVLARVEAQDSAREATRVAGVKGLDDQLEAAGHALATAPGAYRPGTLAALANAYEDVGEAARPQPIRRLAQQETFLLSFAKSSVATQQRLIENLTEGDDRAAAEAIQDRQNEAFTKDAFSAGTALYPDVGPARPLDDMAGRIAQARTIAAYRDISVVPFTADETAQMRRQYSTGTPQQRDAVQTLVNSLPDDMKPDLGGPSSGEPHSYAIDVEASMKALQKLQAGRADENSADGRQGGVHVPEPPPDSPEFHTAEAEAQRQVTLERVNTDRMISDWLNRARPGDEIPAELAEQLGADQKREVEELASSTPAIKSDPAALRMIVNGLKSRNPEEAQRWAQVPLYRYRSQLSAGDFAKALELQRDLDPEDGQSISQLAAIRKQLKAADTSDLTPLYKALEPDPHSIYGAWPWAKDRNGVRLAMPQRARDLLKGFLDLLAGTKNGQLGPDAIDAFTTITGGAGRLFGPRGGAEALAAGGKPPTKPASTRTSGVENDVVRGSAESRELTHLERSAANFAKGKAWQDARAAYYLAKGYKVAEQVTVQLPSGRRIRLDLLFRHPDTKEIVIVELKASKHPRIRRHQREKYEELEKFGGTVVGEGKGEFPGGKRVPPKGFMLETPYNTKQP
jgi:hypothetical protein